LLDRRFFLLCRPGTVGTPLLRIAERSLSFA
jgi:hypothetical protein